MRRSWGFAVAGLLVAGVAPVALGQGAPAAQLNVFPAPGSGVARAESQLSFRGAPAGALGDITVTGSVTGPHPGMLRAHSDGAGASFVPAAPFRAGETVTVATGLDIAGGRDGDYSFSVPGRPAIGQSNDSPLPLPTLPPAAVDRFRSRPDLQSPVVRVTRRAKDPAPGLILLAPFSPKGSPKPDGPLIADNRGDLVWFKPVKRGTAVTDLQVQRLGGKPVLTWWEGRFAKGWGYGEYHVLDSSYREIATIKARNGYRSDLHDMVLTDRGTAILLTYDRVQRDLRFAGGARRGVVVDNVVQEVDIATGLVVFEWHSLGQVGLEESFSHPDGRHSWDYFHINSVEPDTDGNLIVSARNTCALYKINRTTGEIVWRLGGKKSDFKLGKGARFCFQHDARRAGPGVITLFDNQAGPPILAKQSRALRLRVDERARTARVQQAYTHPGGLLAMNQGSARTQPNGNVFVGWGGAPVFSEFSRSGKLLFDGRLTKGKGNYRAVRARWSGRPAEPPAVAARRTGKGGRVEVFASWNGATEVDRWQVLAGGSRERLRGVASKARRGFETAITTRKARYVAVRALDGRGRTLGTSKAIRPRR